MLLNETSPVSKSGSAQANISERKIEDLDCSLPLQPRRKIKDARRIDALYPIQRQTPTLMCCGFEVTGINAPGNGLCNMSYCCEGAFCS